MYTAGPEGVYKAQAAAQAARQEAKSEPNRADQEASFRARVAQLPAEPRAAWPKERGSALLQDLQREATHNPEIAALLPSLNGEIKIMKPGRDDLYRSLIARRGLHLREKRGELADKINSLLIILDDEDGSRELQQLEIQSPQVAQEQRARDQVKIDQLRESLVPPEEKERGEIIRLVLDKGSACLGLDLPTELSPAKRWGQILVGTPGRADVEPEGAVSERSVVSYRDKDRSGINFMSSGRLQGREVKYSLGEMGCSEIVDSSEVTKYKTVTTVTQERSGMFGLKKREVPKTERHATGQMTMQEALSSDAAVRGRLTREELAEPAVRFHYQAEAPKLSRMSGEEEGEVAYRMSHDQRAGSYLAVDILLPRSIAQRVLEHLKQRPDNARQIITSVVRESLHLDEKQWDGLRPPYEKWNEFHKKNGRQPGIYIADKIFEEFDARHVHAFS